MWEMVKLSRGHRQPTYLYKVRILTYYVQYYKGHNNVDTGLLAAPPNLMITSTNLTAIDLNWTPPFTLNITNMDKNIPVYSIRITNHDTGELSVDNSTIPSYTLLSVKAFQCDTFGFQVTGWNSAGEGNISNTVNASFEKRKNDYHDCDKHCHNDSICSLFI